MTVATQSTAPCLCPRQVCLAAADRAVALGGIRFEPVSA